MISTNRVKGGSELKRFEDVCQDEYTAVLKYLTRLCGDASLGKELTQETFYQAQRSWNRFSGP